MAVSKLDGQQQLTFSMTIHHGCPEVGAENSERGSFYFSDVEFFKNNTKGQKKRGGRSPFCPPLNRPIVSVKV